MVDSMFSQYIGIDWSGARGPNLKNLQAAVCVTGRSSPQLVQPPRTKYWRRDDLVRWITDEAMRSRILVGMDFGFAYPYLDEGAYFPGHPQSPRCASDLWQKVDSICQEVSCFYGGPFYKDQTAEFSQYLCYQLYRGTHFDNHRLRRTEQACRRSRMRPASLFRLVGADQVGSGSVAGMRVLHYLATNHSHAIAIWPFDDISQTGSVLVEIYPRLFFACAGEYYQERYSLDSVNAVLNHFHSEPVSHDSALDSRDKADAIVSAAAVRSLSELGHVWRPKNIDELAMQYEGWIFGCSPTPD